MAGRFAPGTRSTATLQGRATAASVAAMSFAQAKAEISKFSPTQQEKLLAMLARFAAEREKNWDDELCRRHGEMLRGRKVSERELLERAGLA